jgi:hypothetical protein
VDEPDDLRQRLRRLAADDDRIAELIGDARAAAEARVHAMLTEAYTDILLEQVRDALAPLPQQEQMVAAPAEPESPAAPEAESPPAPDPEPPPAPEPAPPTDELGWYVYCVVGSDQDPLPDELEGIDSRYPVHALEQSGVAAIVSRVPLAEFGEEPLRQHLSDMEWLERTARRHEHVQEVVARSGTPVPMRLCTIYRNESGVRTMLTRESSALQEALSHLRGKAEWGVKAFAGAEAAEPAPSDSVPEPADGAAYMQSRLHERQRDMSAAARIDEACDALHAGLCAVAVDGVTLALHRPEVTGHDLPMIFNASYLVADADVDAFRREVERLSAELGPTGIEVQQTGPWPPYNFVPGEIGAGW